MPFQLGGSDIDLLISYLDERFNAWGGYDDYEVNSLDTALALQALQSVNYDDLETIFRIR